MSDDTNYLGMQKKRVLNGFTSIRTILNKPLQKKGRFYGSTINASNADQLKTAISALSRSLEHLIRLSNPPGMEAYNYKSIITNNHQNILTELNKVSTHQTLQRTNGYVNAKLSLNEVLKKYA